MIGATAVMVFIVLSLLLLLLAQLYCSLFLRRRRRHPTSTSTTANTPQYPPHPSDLRNFYAQGVLRAPRSFLFPAAADDYSGGEDLEASPNSSATTTTAEQLMTMYNISNPIYDEEGGVRGMRKAEDGGSAGGTPPVTPMKKLRPEWPSVSITGTDSNAANSSSSPSTSTSPSW